MVTAKEMRELTTKRIDEIRSSNRKEAQAFIDSTVNEVCERAMRCGHFETTVTLPVSAKYKRELVEILCELGYQVSTQVRDVYINW